MKKTEDKSVIYKSLWIMGTVMILAVLIIELVSIFLIQRDRRKTERLFSNTIESYGQFWEDKFASTSKALLLMSGTDSTPYYQQLCISKDPLTVETAKVQQQKIMIEMGERYGREMMLFVYVPERNIYFVSTEEGTTYAYQRAFKEKIISYIANQYQEPEKNWIFMEFDGHQYLARIYSAENGYIGAAFSLERIVSGFVGERKDLCVEVRNNETGEIKIHQGTRKSGISTTCVYPLKYTNAQIYVSMDEGMPVLADTTAMGAPHEIDYTLTFYSDSIGSKSQLPQEAAKRVVAVAVVIIVGGGILNYFVNKRNRC